MIDRVVYPSTVPVLRFIEPLVGESAVLVFDGWARRDTCLNDQGKSGPSTSSPGTIPSSPPATPARYRRTPSAAAPGLG